MKNFYKNKKVLITGAAGTIGQELIKQLLELNVSEIKAIDNNEAELFYLNEQFIKEKRVNGFFCDIRDLNRLTYLCKDVEVILHTAAMKHVVISEISPLDAAKTNVDGTANVIEAALNSDKVERVIYTSSDKAVNPTNVMGTTKLLGERLMTSALNIRGARNIIFSSTRFGNVIGSKGSVVPIFFKQIRDLGHITLTDTNMTRFIMTIPEATSLVLQASLQARGGEVFVTKMPVMRIEDLGQAMIDLVSPIFGKRDSDVFMKVIGKKPGEKFYEELMTDEETHRAIELKNMFVVKPAFPPMYDNVNYDAYEDIINQSVKDPYISSRQPFMTVDQIKEYLIKHSVIENMRY